jgi:signal transduction histidine kinase/ActR/RegA family two-component response regulator
MSVSDPRSSKNAAEQEWQAHLPELLREAEQDQIRRMAHGVYVYPPMLMVLIATTPYPGEHPEIFWSCTAAILTAMLMRVTLLPARNHLAAISPRRLYFILVANIALGSGGLGLLHFCDALVYGLESWTFSILMLWVVGTGCGATISFTPNFRLMRLHIVLLLGPAFALGLWMGGTKGNAFALANFLLIAFLILQGHRLNRAYWERLRSRALETIRARELEAAKVAAEAASVAKGQFLANISHEIRTPLHGILGMARLALDPGASLEQARAYLGTIDNCAEGLLHILNDVLDFSKIEAGKLVLERIAFSISKLIAEAHQIVLPQAIAKGLLLECQAAAEIPDVLVGDPARLRQVLLNLLGNAVKFTEAGSVRLHVATAPSPEAGSVQLRSSVADTGIGIPKEQQERIFEAFAQADGSVSRRFGGTGLGLSICSHLVQLMGGKLTVESTPNAGSTFEFTCSLGIVAEAHEHSASSSPQTWSSRPLRILLAEDNPVNQLIATRILNRRGHEVTVVSTGMQAIKTWEAERFDLILIDNQMPEMGGVEAVKRIRQGELALNRPRTAIVALTASAMAGDRGRFLFAGMDGYLAKPFRAEELDAVMSQALMPATA